MNNTETDKIYAQDKFIVYGWKDNYTDRIVTTIPSAFGICCYTENPYCRGSVVYGMKCVYNTILESYFISEENKNKVLNAYVYYTLEYQDECDHNFEALQFIDAVHSDYLEMIYKYADNTTK
jgi:hypothetical protein